MLIFKFIVYIMWYFSLFFICILTLYHFHVEVNHFHVGEITFYVITSKTFTLISEKSGPTADSTEIKRMMESVKLMINLLQITGHEFPSPKKKKKTAIRFWNKFPDASLRKQGGLSVPLFYRLTWAMFYKLWTQSLGRLSHYLGINCTAILG